MNHLEFEKEDTGFAGPVYLSSRIVVGVLGALSREKGADFLEELASYSRRNKLPFDFKLIGYGYRSLKHVEATGPYQHSELSSRLKSEGVNVILFPARCPETYSYTLSASLRMGYPIMAPIVGAFPERLSGRPNVCLYPLDSSVEHVAGELLRFCEALSSGVEPRAPTYALGSPSERFYEDVYALQPVKTRSDFGSTCVVDLYRNVMKIIDYSGDRGWKRSLRQIIFYLHRLPLSRKLIALMPLDLKARLKRQLYKWVR